MATTLGFVGLGVMGESMCRNLARKSKAAVVAFDRRGEPLASLARDGVEAAASVRDVLARADVVFLCLPGERDVRAVALGPDGLATSVRRGQTVVDMSTTPVALARELGRTFMGLGVDFADAPVARTAQAARDGTLSIMVGADGVVFERLRPYLACMGTEITHCGAVGAGQAVKLMNNMVVAQTVVALAEAIAVARASGAVEPRVLFETLAKSSADSFVLRNHGMKSLLPDTHPTQGAFPTSYIIKDLTYALALAESAGLTLEQATTTRRLMERTAEAGYRDHYYTAVSRVIAQEAERMPQYIPSPRQWVREQVELYEGSGGTQGTTLRDTGLPVIIVTHTGNKSGAIRKTPLMRVKDGANYVLVGSMGGAPTNPVWVYNLRTRPDVEIRDHTAVQPMRVREVSDETERARLWKVAVAAFPPYEEYQGKTARRIPVFLAEPRA
ncbi:MAG TPA: nitroreductase/quinone reductase family protein [Methylomirabilota bacterium]|nr:nitroreductase/quinone reductase family protein [Methylomirabilota bacterium]